MTFWGVSRVKSFGEAKAAKVTPAWTVTSELGRMPTVFMLVDARVLVSCLKSYMNTLPLQQLQEDKEFYQGFRKRRWKQGFPLEVKQHS